jgi:pyruvate/2-oxoglutarate dehydrogenase complex dihydrolipoamide acyltransferase (E2) component
MEKRMKITAKIDAKTALAAGKDQVGRQEMHLDIGALTSNERALLGQVSVSQADGLEITHYEYAAHNMPALDLQSLRAYLARIAAAQAEKAADQARVAAAKAACCEEMRVLILSGELPSALKDSYRDWSGVTYDQYKELIGMPETQALLAAAEQAAAEQAAAEQAAAEQAAAAKAAAVAAAHAEMLAWIAANGSPRLRRCVAEGIQCGAAYRDERLATERPGWRWYADVRGTFDTPSSPTEEAFALLDSARKTAPDAKLGWQEADEETDDMGEVTADKWEGYIAHADFLALVIIFGGPLE